MILIEKNLLNEIQRRAAEFYPGECCGILAGTIDPKEVISAHPADNINTESAHDQYEIDPGEFRRIDEDARGRGLNIIGIYHSHPDHPCAPSEFDTIRAWEEYSYIITSVDKGQNIKSSSWVLDSNGRFIEEEIVIK